MAHFVYDMAHFCDDASSYVRVEMTAHTAPPRPPPGDRPSRNRPRPYPVLRQFDGFASLVAAPVWALIWLLTLGCMGQPLWVTSPRDT